MGVFINHPLYLGYSSSQCGIEVLQQHQPITIETPDIKIMSTTKQLGLHTTYVHIQKVGMAGSSYNLGV
jgi:hypothetical protein